MRFTTNDQRLSDFLVSQGFRLRFWRDLCALGSHGQEFGFDDTAKLREAVRTHQRSVGPTASETVIGTERDLLRALTHG